MKYLLLMSALLIGSGLMMPSRAHAGDDGLVIYPDSAPTYTVLEGGRRLLHIGNLAWGPGWSWFAFDGPVSVADGRRSFEQERDIGGTQDKITMKHLAWQAAPDRIVLEFELSAPQDARLTAIVATLEPGRMLSTGGRAIVVSADGTQKEVKLPFGGPGLLGESVKRIRLEAADGTEVVVEVEPARTVTVDGAARIELLGDSIKAREMRRTRIALTFPGTTRFIADKRDSLVATDTTDWFPYPVGPAGVPIDLSFLNKDEDANYVPAGAHGFLTVKDGDFVFEDGTAVRFWGLNLTAGAALGSPERSAQLAERLARLGVNVVRLHHLDSWHNPIIDYNHPDGTTQHLSVPGMAALDRTIFELKARGIYVIPDPWVQRCFTAQDGVADYGNMGRRGNFGLHPYVYFDARMRQLIKKTLEQVWTHVNPLTGLAYKDDPAIVMTEVINEGLMQRGPDDVAREPYRTNFIRMYEDWASANEGIPNLGDAIIRENWGENNLRFYVHVHRDFYADMHRHLRRIGVRIPINATNWAGWPWEITAQSDLDFMDCHHYYGGNQIGPGSGLGGLWLSNPPRGSDTPFGKIAGFAVPGKPVASSEWGNNPPKTYRSAYLIGMAAVASFQGWDSFTGYAYSQSTGPRDGLDAFEWEADPASVASMAAGALIFRRGDVSPARQTVAFTFPDGELWELHWQDGGARDFRSTAGFNVAIEQHKVAVVLGKEVPRGLQRDSVMTTVEAYEYEHPGTEIVSDTGELWRDWRLGVGTINTPRSQVAYGKLGESGGTLRTADCTFEIATPFAVTALSSLSDEPIAESGRLLLTAVARAENTGQAGNLARTRIENRGQAPVLAEPVVGSITMKTSKPALVMYPIMVDGRRGPAVRLPVTDGVARIELRAAYRTVFYEIVATE